MRTALLIIDAQNDYFPGGKMALHNSVEASIKIKELIECFRNKTMPIIHVQHIATRPDATFFLPDTPGSEFQENVKPLNNEKIMVKHYPNSFRETQLHEYLQTEGITQLIIVGMMTHMCIDTTVRAAYDLGYACFVVSDACATKDLVLHDKKIPATQVQNAFLTGLNGLFAQVVYQAEIIALLRENRI